jgi:hypothetical protein
LIVLQTTPLRQYAVIEKLASAFRISTRTIKERQKYVFYFSFNNVMRFVVYDVDVVCDNVRDCAKIDSFCECGKRIE